MIEGIHLADALQVSLPHAKPHTACIRRYFNIRFHDVVM